FDTLPAPAKEKVYARLYDVLSGKEQGSDYDILSTETRREILEILRDTKFDLPDYWRKAASIRASK
ncbi:MAG TPA: hypothetical protein VGR78_10390, partial [Verrucomicrobiae bacterium]|nr:hypothetical protein [Verrucomicrobiae bacterium]